MDSPVKISPLYWLNISMFATARFGGISIEKFTPDYGWETLFHAEMAADKVPYAEAVDAHKKPWFRVCCFSDSMPAIRRLTPPSYSSIQHQITNKYFTVNYQDA